SGDELASSPRSSLLSLPPSLSPFSPLSLSLPSPFPLSLSLPPPFSPSLSLPAPLSLSLTPLSLLPFALPSFFESLPAPDWPSPSPALSPFGATRDADGLSLPAGVMSMSAYSASGRGRKAPNRRSSAMSAKPRPSQTLVICTGMRNLR